LRGKELAPRFSRNPNHSPREFFENQLGRPKMAKSGTENQSRFIRQLDSISDLTSPRVGGCQPEGCRAMDRDGRQIPHLRFLRPDSLLSGLSTPYPGSHFHARPESVEDRHQAIEREPCKVRIADTREVRRNLLRVPSANAVSQTPQAAEPASMATDGSSKACGKSAFKTVSAAPDALAARHYVRALRG